MIEAASSSPTCLAKVTHAPKENSETRRPDLPKRRYSMTAPAAVIVLLSLLLEKQPTRKFVQPGEVAALAVFLCRDEAQNINGANYTMDGGWTAG